MVSDGRWKKISAQKFLHVEAEHLAAAHGLVAARGGEDPARLPQPHAACLRDAAREVRVFAVKLDRRVESADGLQRIAPDGEVAAVEHGAEAEHVLREHVRQRREAVVVHADEHAPDDVPVVEAVGPGHGDGRMRAVEFLRDELEPVDAARGSRHRRRRARRRWTRGVRSRGRRPGPSAVRPPPVYRGWTQPPLCDRCWHC